MPKNKGGRPPKYKNKEEIEGLIEKYFEDCKGKPYLDDKGVPVHANNGKVLWEEYPHPPTVTGLALALGFTTRHALLNYQGKEEFVHTITRAKTYIEEYAERRLYDREGVQGAKFVLINNFKNWSDSPKNDDMEELLEKLDSILGGIDDVAKS